MFSKNVLWVYVLISFILGCLCSVFLLAKNQTAVTAAYAAEKPQNSTSNGFAVCRVKEFSNIKPLSKEPVSESPMFTSMKGELMQLIDSLKSAGTATQASVYIREFDQRGWMALNKDEKFHPASLMKVPLLICYLRMAQANPALLKQELVYQKPAGTQITPQFYSGPTIEQGKKYTVHDLLYYTMAYSDNHATWLLSQHLDKAVLSKLFTDFCLPEPKGDDAKFVMTASECSVFFRAIYTASCVGPEYSEYAAQLMSNCTFKEGFVKGFPQNTKMWHKFGEWRGIGYDHELHEAGVVFIKDKPYLIAVMTKGKDTAKLATAISAICNRIYQTVPSP